MKMKKWFHPNGKRFLSRLLGGVLAGVLLTVSLCAEPVLAEGSKL